MSQSLAPECNELKERYDTCFLKWYSEKYLRGIGTTDNNECSALFKQYSTCLHRALKDRGIDKLLDEAREDNKENDAAMMGKKKCNYTKSSLRRHEHSNGYSAEKQHKIHAGPRWLCAEDPGGIQTAASCV